MYPYPHSTPNSVFYFFFLQLPPYFRHMFQLTHFLCWTVMLEDNWEILFSTPFKSLFVSNICPQNLGEKISIPAALYLCFIWCLFNLVTDIFFLNILPSFFFMHFPVPPCSYYFPFFIPLKFKLRFYLFYDYLFSSTHFCFLHIIL